MTTPELAPLRARLPRIAPAEAALRAALLRRLGGRATSDGLRLAVRIQDAPFGGALLRFSGGVSAAPLRVDGRPALWTATASPAVLPEALAEFSALEPLLAAVEQGLDLPLDPVDLAALETDGLSACVEARDGAGRLVHAMTLVLGREVALSVPPSSAAPVPLGAAAAARTTVRLSAAGPEVPAGELDGLRAGDLVLAPSVGGALRVRLTVAGSRTWRGDWRPGDGRFTGDGMDDAYEAAATGTTAAEPLRAPGDLPVRLTFELASAELPLAEVAALAPGAVLSVPAAGDPPAVTVLAGGARLARGRLVALGDGYGVLIDELAAGSPP